MTKHQICLATSQNFYEGLSRAFRDPGLTTVEADLSRIHYIFPWQLTLAACLKAWCRDKAELHFQWNRSKKHQNEIASYAERMGLFEGMGEALICARADLRKDFNSENYFELHSIDQSKPKDFRDQFARLLGRFPGTAGPLLNAFEDLSQNIVDHSGTKEGCGWGYVQAQTTASRLRIAFCDFGVGYYKTYQRNNMLHGRSPREILESSLDPRGSSAVSPASYQGLGLAKACAYLSENKGSMEIFSDGLKCRYSMGKKSSAVLGYRTKGALISIEVPLRRERGRGFS